MDDYQDSFLFRLSFFVGVVILGVGLFLVMMHLSATDTVNAQSSNTNSYTPPNPLVTLATRLNKDIDSAGHTVSTGAKTVAMGTVNSAKFAGKTVAIGASFVLHVPGKVINTVSPSKIVSSTIRPADNMQVPTITQLHAQQAQIIQTGTEQVSITAASQGAGGACDIGEGNGGYPMSWCNAPMDSVPTINYSGDHINRECTSYAYWYFSTIEGHSDLSVHGNAKYWAATSNYPTHAAPAVGAIGVETAGVYGHVAIVQALPGQKYEGQTVPSGYVLVSEMNYDWNGHFRYSYSPLSKFSAYIYR